MDVGSLPTQPVTPLTQSVTSVRRPREGRRPLRKTLGRIWFYRHLYLLALPGILYFLIFSYLPMWGIVIAFKDFRLFKGMAGSPWVGFAHFQFFFTSPNFPRLLRNTLIISGLNLAFVFPSPILLALLLNEVKNAAYKRIVQTISYLPHFISWVVVGGLLLYTFSQSIGVVNIWLQHQGAKPLIVLGNAKAFLPLMVGTGIWKEVGWEAIIYLAAIAGINPELYEAATVDGASRFQRMLNITLPSIAPVIVILLILQISSILNSNFLQLLILQGNDASLYDVSDVIDTWVYRAGFLKAQMSLATAVGLFKGVIGLVLVWLANKFAHRITDSGLW
jgi:putative aldouronate transport system permease protein